MEGYRNKLTAQQLTGGRVGGVVGLVERELRERLKMQEREMAEQLDKMEVHVAIHMTMSLIELMEPHCKGHNS